MDRSGLWRGPIEIESIVGLFPPSSGEVLPIALWSGIDVDETWSDLDSAKPQVCRELSDQEGIFT